ncbi:MAG: hypothetical protein IVW54_22305 [Candidatus Binataceae bacterium]|nr:hypothetical protein [Candidatus Binataceae bacterium]
MAGKRKPLGVYSRSTQDWFVRRMQVGEVNFTPSSGNLAIAVLFNNTNSGKVLYPVGFTFHLGAVNGDIRIETYIGNPGGAAATFGQHMVDPTAPVTAGLVLQQSVPTCIGQHLWDFWYNNNGVPISWPYNWPIMRLPSGCSMIVECGSFNVALAGSICWIELDD